MTPQLFENRQYQSDALEASWQRFSVGIYRQALSLPTASGKTVIFSGFHKKFKSWFDQFPENQRKILVVAHREELLDQAADKFSKVNPDLYVDVEQGDRRASPMADVVIASVPTLAASKGKRMGKFPKDEFRMVIVDECLPAGTLVDGRPIETIKRGDDVTARDHGARKNIRARVVRTFKSRPTGLLKIVAGGKMVVCTPGHPFYTPGGYVPAVELTKDDYVYGYQELRGVRETVHDARQRFDVFGNMPGLPEASDGVAVLSTGMQRLRIPFWESGSGTTPGGCCLLFGQMPRTGPLATVERYDGSHQQDLRVSKNARAEPNGKARYPQEGERGASRNGTQTTKARRKRDGANEVRGVAHGRTGEGWIAGVSTGSSDAHEERERISHSLQNRPSKRATHAGDRSGRRLSWDACPESARQEERDLPGWVRVDSVEVLERGSDGTFGGLCPDGHVYNFEVERFNNYFANGILVHNCHHSTADTYRRVVENFGFLPPHDWHRNDHRPASKEEALAMQRERLAQWDAQHPKDRILIGVTATLKRGDNVGLEAIFQEVVFSRTIREMVEAGFLCKLRGFRVTSKTSLDKVSIRAGDFAVNELADAVDNFDRNLLAVKAYEQYAPNRKAIVFCTLVAHARHVAELFNQAGIPAAVAHGEMDKDERKKVLGDFRNGSLKVLTNANLLLEGYDDPSVDCIIHAKPTKSQLVYVQATGRGCRLFPGKEDCVVIDITDVSRKHRLCALPELVGLPCDFDLNGGGMVEAVGAVEKLKAEHPTLDVDTAKSLKQLETAVEEFDLLAVGPDDTVKALATLSWQRDGDTYWVSYKRDGQDLYVELRPEIVDGEAKWAGWIATDRTAQKIIEPLPLKEGFAKAEKWFTLACPDTVGLVAMDRNWRKEKVTDRQAYLLRRLGWQGLTAETTRGEANDAISAMFRKKNKESSWAA